MTKQAYSTMLIFMFSNKWFMTLVAKDIVGDINQAIPFSQGLFTYFSIFLPIVKLACDQFCILHLKLQISPHRSVNFLWRLEIERQ